MNRLIVYITALFAAMPGLAADTGVQMTIGLSGDAESRLLTYRCEGADEVREVRYINAAPNFLALTEVGGEDLIFVSTLAASGVRYVSGQYVWWTKGAEASLYDETQGPDAPPAATCLEANEIP